MYNNGGVFGEFKNAFNRPNNAHIQLILINVAVFAFLAILRLVAALSNLPIIFGVVYEQFSIPPIFADFITRPWTIITYAFAHDLSSIFHILFNMLAFYWFARLVVEYLGSDRVISIYVIGAISGAIFYLLAYNFVPYYIERSGISGMVGASAAVYAVVVAAATLLPNYSFNLMFIGPVKIKYIAAFYIGLSILGSVGSNAGGNVAHIGGAFMGWVYIKQLQKGHDWGTWILAIVRFFKRIFSSNPKIKVSYKRKAKAASSSKKSTINVTPSAAQTKTDQEEIDAILDKISERGYESLSKEEKQKLFNASKS